MIELKGKPVADQIDQKIISAMLNRSGHRPHLTVVLVGNDGASQVYVQHKQKACKKLGFESNLVQLPADVSEKDLTFELHKLNNDLTVDAILLQLPLPPHLDPKRFTELIRPEKDADALTSASLGKLLTGQHLVASCTPAGIIEILKFYEIDVARKNVLVIGRSQIVGLPLFHLLNQLNATVTLAHSKTSELKKLILQFDFVFVAVGKAHFLKSSDFKKGAVVIDVGIHRLPTGLTGDVDPEGAAGHLAALTPVPGGVGPMTIAMLMQNTFTLAEKKRA